MDKELTEWKKISIGIGIGSILMAIFLGKFSHYEEDFEVFDKGGQFSIGIIAFLFGAYFWRKEVLSKKLHLFERSLNMSGEELEELFIALDEKRKEPK